MEKLALLILTTIPAVVLAQTDGNGREIPEPSSLALIGSAVVAVGLAHYLKKRKSK